MKKALKISIGLLFSITILNAQDTLVLKNKSKIMVKVMEVGPNNISYVSFLDLGGPTLNINKSEIDYIKYSDGYKQTIEVNSNITANDTPIDLYNRGQKDAEYYYEGYHGAATGTLVVSLLLSPLVGLIPAIACSATPPKIKNLEYPDSQLFQKPDYQNGYIKHAKKVKSRKVWTNWGIALGVNVVLALLLQ